MKKIHWEKIKRKKWTEKRDTRKYYTGKEMKEEINWGREIKLKKGM